MPKALFYDKLYHSVRAYRENVVREYVYLFIAKTCVGGVCVCINVMNKYKEMVDFLYFTGEK